MLLICIYVFSSIFNQSLNHWDTTNVTNMESMFLNATSFIDLNLWNTSNVTNMLNFLSGATSYQQSLQD